MGGSGKTTLARLLYNDDRVKEHFHLKAWVCVSTEFLLIKVTKSFLEEIGSKTDSDNLNKLQLELKDQLSNKKFLLVLDDVWDLKPRDWEVQTRHLGQLSPQNCWRLFEKLAFEDRDSNAFLELEPIGRQIVDKCQGLPLAVKALGRLLHSKVEKREWENVLNSEIWHLRSGPEILPSLRLSYHHLSLPLKHCFAYCSIFPRNHEFDKEKLILLWMAEGLLHPQLSDRRRMEEIGESYFDELLAKSFFQKSIRKKGSCFVMHDLIHELAQHVSGDFCARVEDDDKVPKVSEKTQYKIIDLPKSIGNLKHLRYLDLSFTMIQKLPESLINLRHLDIFGCDSLKEMSNHGIGQLKSLQRLTYFIVGQKSGLKIGELRELPEIRGALYISNMKNVVSVNDALQANMKDKSYLDELILDWDDRCTDVLNLVSLELRGCGNCSTLPPLGQLTHLKYLQISRMNGVECVGSEFHGNASFQSLETLSFEDMLNWEKWLCCEEFPHLRKLSMRCCPKLTGKLPEQLLSLEELQIYNCPQLLMTSLTVLAIRELKMVNFGKLQSLHIVGLPTTLRSLSISQFDSFRNQWS
ncbi:unnamed protein product, partial [Vitis vinifera]